MISTNHPTCNHSSDDSGINHSAATYSTAKRYSRAGLLTTGSLLSCSLLMTAALAGGFQHIQKPAIKKSAAKANSGSATKADSETVTLGKKVYAANGCATCHAISGKGGTNGPDLTQTGAVPTHTSQWLAEQVANPKAHTPDSAMPGYAQTIKGKNLTALAAYLADLKGAVTSAATSPTAAHPGAAIDPGALAQITKLGGQAGPIAQDDNHLTVNLRMGGAAVTDSSLAALNKLTHVTQLDLGNTAITDAGLAQLKGMKELTVLHLEGTKVTDAGLVNVKDLRGLTYLNLYNTNISDAGLEHLTHLTNLRHLYVWQTKVTDAGVAKLKQTLSQLDVIQGLTAPPTVSAPPKK